MTDSPATRASLLLRMRDAKDHEAWHTFVELYAPLVYRFARKRGLQDADAADLTQEVLGSVADAMKSGKYDAARGSFRAWLFTETRNAVHKLLRGGKRQPIGSGDSHVRDRLEQVATPDEQEEWEIEYQKQLFAWACDEVRSEFKENTWQSFWQTAINDRGVKEVSQQLGMSAGSIYVAKSRILMRIKEKIEQTEIELPAVGAKNG